MEEKIKLLDNEELKNNILNYINGKRGFTLSDLLKKWSLKPELIRYLSSYLKAKEGLNYSRREEQNNKYNLFELNIEEYRKDSLMRLVKKLDSDILTINCFFYYYFGKHNIIISKK